jgi:hypothetical protein
MTEQSNAIAALPRSEPETRWLHPDAPTPAAGELQTMREGMADLVELLGFARPHGTEGELAFLREFLIPRLRELGCAVDVDGFGNLWTAVKPRAGYAGPAILWSCHVDTMDGRGGKKAIRWSEDGRTLKLKKGKAGTCLGADDGAGVWLLLRMIAAGVPGAYVFHRGEEKGRLGSCYVEETEPERLASFDACIAFDRRDYADLITHQMGERCASEAFALSFAGALNAAGRGLDFRPDDTGSYTDSYSYKGLVSECCNVSVGYDREHGPRETLDALHLWRLCEAICAADLGGLVIERDCTVIDYDGWGYGGGYGSGWGRVSGGSRTGAAAWAGDDDDGARPFSDDEGETLLEIVRRYPRAVAELLGLYGIDGEDVAGHMTDAEVSGAVMAGLLGVGEPKAAAGGWAHD